MKAVNYKFPNFNQYCSTYQRQSFSLPDSIIYYIRKRSLLSPKFYKKLIKVCKYFFIKKPYLVLHCLKYVNEKGWRTCSNDDSCDGIKCYNRVKLYKVYASKLWITYQLEIEPPSTTRNVSIASNVIKKIGIPPSTGLALYDQILTLNDFKFLSTRIKVCHLDETIIKASRKKEVEIEEIFKCIPNLNSFIYTPAKKSKSFSSITIEKLLEKPFVKALENVELTF